MIKVKSCGILCLFNGKVLLMKHENRYDLPKGHERIEESEMACAFRELNEETGIKKEQLTLDESYRFSTTYHPRYKRFGNKKVEKTVVLFLADLEKELVPELTEHNDYEWVDLDFRCSNNTINELLEDVKNYRA
jgi:8-oxo-dGTP pyrophosphatase MutT (NUDIX family)